MFDLQPHLIKGKAVPDTDLRSRILRLPRLTKQLLLLCSDVIGLLVCLIAAAALVGTNIATENQAAVLAAAALGSAILLGAQQGIYHSIIRYVGIDLAKAGIATAVGSGLTLAAAAMLQQVVAVPIQLSVVYTLMAMIYLVSVRYLARFALSRRVRSSERVIIYGAGEAGARLLHALQDSDAFDPVGLVDDDRNLHRKRVSGLRVHPPADLPKLVQQRNVTRVLLALPSASRRQRQSIITGLERLAVRVQKIPDLYDLVSGKARVDEIREVDAADLLGRDSVPPDESLLNASIAGKSVMVTGAGGSIGSELCRQALRLAPKTLILFELSEVALYNIDKELRRKCHSLGIDCEIVPLLGSVHHENRVFEVMRTFGVNTVYHAAAYKHVPVVEQNILEGVHNNVFGTLHAARAAAEAGVESFVLVSTDKAVNPTNVMGATKRMSELVLQAMQTRFENVRFCMVRFGNVLESSGSVVPLFREQICAGGPVTVTHRDIIRYFMTIPEAAQLVIQAGAMAQGGDVFVLDMGDPVRIRDLAARMINLMGLTVRDEENPDGDIEIQYTGLRPAEKLYEELLIERNVVGTKHPRIMRASEERVAADKLLPALNRLKELSAELDREGVREVLVDFVTGYTPNNGIDDLVWLKGARKTKAADKDSETVVELNKRSA